MTRLACLLALLLPAAAVAADPPKPTVLAKDLAGVFAVTVTPDGRTFVATGLDADGAVSEVKDGKAVKLTDLPGPFAMTVFQQSLFVANKQGVHRIDIGTGKAEVWAALDDFPDKVGTIWRLTADERGVVYALAARSMEDATAIYSIGAKFGPRGKPVRGEIKKVAASDGKREFGRFGLLSDGLNHLLAFGARAENSGKPGLVRVKVADGGSEQLTDNLGGVRALCGDAHGRVFVLSDTIEFADEPKFTLWGIARPGEKPVKVCDLPGGPFAGLAYHPVERRLVFADNQKHSLLAIPAQIPGWEVDESPLIVEAVPAFADVTWTGWDDGSASGRSNPFRPLVLTHANDGSGRTFVATQQGVIHNVEKGAKASKVFLDLQSKVLYKDNENEQGLLGLAFHPDYKTTTEFFVFYTDKSKKLENVLSRFKVSKDDPNKADPASEQELLRVSHKYWNHDGGTLAFGPDGFLYVVLGDGGSANDPDDHGQKTDVLLGKILRIDVNAKGDTTPYAIPKDNPFVGKKEYRPEIFALGVRNPWRMSFDRKTGQGWFGEVGQNLWEEINLLDKGANYGWRRRESLHPFGADGSGPKKEFTDPIWEYSHEVGKSITGGHVYRGKEVPALDGHYLYADYVSTKVWALKYDEKVKRVTANRPVAAPKLAWMTFGEDEAGEVYLMTYAANGKGIYKFKAGK